MIHDLRHDSQPLCRHSFYLYLGQEHIDCQITLWFLLCLIMIIPTHNTFLCNIRWNPPSPEGSVIPSLQITRSHKFTFDLLLNQN